MCLGITAAAVFAQDSGALNGVVVDQLGGVIGGARLTVRDAVGAVIQTATTDVSGAFSVTGLSSGSYDLQVERDLFEPTRQRIDLVQDAPLPLLRLTMKIAGFIEDVVVTGRRAEGRLSETPQKIEIITRDDIERSAAQDLLDVLKKNAAIDVAQFSGVFGGIGIRGFRPEPEGLNRRSLVLIDGRPAGNTNLATLLLDNVERIEVQKGPSSVDEKDNVYVTDWGNDRVLVFDCDSNHLATWHGDSTLSKWAIERIQEFPVFAEQRRASGLYGQERRFWRPAGIAASSTGRVVVVDSCRHRMQVYRREPVGGAA